jgi:glutathione S-transferase
MTTPWPPSGPVLSASLTAPRRQHRLRPEADRPQAVAVKLSENVVKIYGDSISGNCLKVKWTADLLGLGYDWIETDVLKAESRTPQFLAMNPAGQVPAVLLDDGRPLAQSNAIILHLAEGSALIPEDPYERAKMLEWMFWEQYSHEPYVAVARFQVRFLGKSVAELEPRMMERGRAALQRLDDALDGVPFLVGSTVSLADVALVAYTREAGDGGFDLAKYPNVQAWIGRVERALGIAS